MATIPIYPNDLPGLAVAAASAIAARQGAVKVTRKISQVAMASCSTYRVHRPCCRLGWLGG